MIMTPTVDNQQLLNKNILEILLPDCNESNNKHYIKYRNCYADYNEFKSIVTDTYIALYYKIEDENNNLYASIKYIYTTFRNKTIENYRNRKKSGMLYVQEFSDYLHMDTLLDESFIFNRESSNAILTFHKIAKHAKLTESELAIFIDCYGNSMGHKNIAEKYSISKRKVQYLISGAMKKIKESVVVKIEQ